MKDFNGWLDYYIAPWIYPGMVLIGVCMLLCGSYNSDEENQENTNGTGTKECGIERKQMPLETRGQNYNSIFFLLHYIYGVQVVPQLCR